jgi:hypothetical protein
MQAYEMVEVHLHAFFTPRLTSNERYSSKTADRFPERVEWRGKVPYAFLVSNPDSSVVQCTTLAVTSRMSPAVATFVFTGHRICPIPCRMQYLILVFYEGMTRERWRKYQEG